MKKNKYTFISLFFIIIIIGLLFLLNQYNKPSVDVTNLDADLVINVDEILKDFQKDEEKANLKYTNNIIEVHGEISKISTVDGNATITLKDNQFDSNVICNVQPQENKEVLQLKKGDQISLKGICTGYLLDVIMVKCVIENN